MPHVANRVGNGPNETAAGRRHQPRRNACVGSREQADDARGASDCQPDCGPLWVGPQRPPGPTTGSPACGDEPGDVVDGAVEWDLAALATAAVLQLDDTVHEPAPDDHDRRHADQLGVGELHPR